MSVVLVGFMGAGKTTVGHILADRLGLPFVDSDVLIEQRLGRTIREIFETEGEPHFRELEHRTVAELVRGQDAVVALGGGALGDPRTRVVLRNARVVYLHVGYAEAMARVETDEFRPMLRLPQLADIYRDRLPVYEELSAITVDTDGRRPEAVALEVLGRLTALPQLPPGARSVFVTPVGGAYHAHIGPGLVQHVAALLPELPECEQAALLATPSDAVVADAVAAQLQGRGWPVTRVALPDGAATKTLDTFAAVCEQLADAAIHKGDVLVAVGGESVCDLAGFVAATFNRGIKHVLIPTTLSAQADASVGGKSGLNLSRGVNLIGAIHQPVSVISDVEVAAQTSSGGYAAGLAEIAKHALISSSDLLAFLFEHAEQIRSGDLDLLRAAITRSIEVKADIVSRDERDEGDRLVLNYGHTFAHAMDLVRDAAAHEVSESASEGAAEADSLPLGLMAAAHLSHRLGRIDREVVETHRRLLTSLGLPTTGRFALSDLKDAWVRDKKYRQGTRFIVLNGLGRPEVGVTAGDDVLAQVLADLAVSNVA